MKKYNILNKNIYYNHSTLSFYLNESSYFDKTAIPRIDNYLNKARITSYTFCLDISDNCNLSCDYCFNKSKSGGATSYAQAINYLEKMFKTFPSGEKYFVDLSGKGEPLLYLKTIIQIADWCKKKQDELRVEVLPQLVCNGTLLTKEVASILQKHGILFGVSVDGNKDIHNLHRKTKDGKETFDIVIDNVEMIQNKDYVGCAATLTKDVFPLLESISDLSKTFKTISFRPARGEFCFDAISEQEWEKEYDRLALRLIYDVKMSDNRLFLCLMNGDDYFGRFLNKAFGRQITLNRCDAGISRFALDLDGNVYGCPAMTMLKNQKYDTIERSLSKQNLYKQAHRCKGCDFKFFCGGECEVVLNETGDPNPVMCAFKQHLILLANYLQLYCEQANPKMDVFLENFSIEKSRRMTKDKKLEDFLIQHPNLSFTEGKLLFDVEQKRY